MFRSKALPITMRRWSLSSGLVRKSYAPVFIDATRASSDDRSIVGVPRAMESSSPLPLLLHDIYNQTSQRFREEVGRLMGHAFPCRRDGLHFADPGRVEQQGSGSRSLRHPIQSFM